MTTSTLRLSTRSWLPLLLLAAMAPAQRLPAPGVSPPIQDNSFLVEEAYNQEAGVVQHISVYSRLWNRKDWSYAFTQEWPGRNPRHQFSYTLQGAHCGDYAGSGTGW